MKWLYNLYDRLQRRRGILFDLLVLGNEISIRAIFILTGKRWKIKPFDREFSAKGEKYRVRSIGRDYLDRLLSFFTSEISAEDRANFNPHSLDARGLKKVFRYWHCVPLGIFSGGELAGYCVIRIYFPNKALYAIIVGEKWRNRGIGSGALSLEMEYIAQMGFKPLSAVRKDNLPSLRMLDKVGIRFGKDCGGIRETLEVGREQPSAGPPGES